LPRFTVTSGSLIPSGHSLMPSAHQIRWETNVKNGVCAVSFDRKDIEMNKFAVGCLEAQFHMFDARTQHQVGLSQDCL
jgi:hypothetical protein